MRLSKNVALILLVASLAFAGCSGGGDEEPTTPEAGEPSEEPTEPVPTVTVTETVTPTPTETVSAATCPNQEAAVSSPAFRAPGRLSGEMDGDGIADRVHLAIDEGGEPRCQAFIVVESEGAVRSVPIEVADLQFEMGFPRLISMPLIDDREGAELVLGVAAGASTQFAAVYTAVDGGIVQVVRSDATGPEDSLLGFGGSVGHQDAFDCAPEKGEGVVVVSEAVPVGNGSRFEYTRRFFVPDGPAVYTVDPSLEETGTVRFNRFDTLHEFPNAPFGGCETGEIAG